MVKERRYVMEIMGSNSKDRALSLAARQRGGCASKPCAFIQVGLSVSETFSLLFDLLPLLSIGLYYIALSCILIP